MVRYLWKIRDLNNEDYKKWTQKPTNFDEQTEARENLQPDSSISE